MADLDSCYFCGAVDESLDEHALIPESLDPPADRQRTVVACPTCAGKLDRALEPVVSFLTGEGERGPATTSDGEESPGNEGPPSAPRPPGRESDSPGESADDDLPEGARDVLRLLRNRPFPVDRTEIESVATSAYELGQDEVRGAIDALVDRDVLREEDGELRKSS